MTFPTLVTVGWHQYQSGATGTDAYGETPPDPVYVPPLSSPGTSINVIGVAPRTTEHMPMSGHDRIITNKTMYAAVGCPVGTYDYIDLPEGQYMVEGIAEDWATLNPFAPFGGVEYQLRRVTG